MKKFIFLSYSFFLFLFTVFSYAFVDPNLFYLKSIYTGFAFDNKFLTTILYVLLIFIFFIYYLLFIVLYRRNKLVLKDIKILISATIIILFLAYPAMLSYDIFNYLTTAKVFFSYQENPYIIMPIELIGEPFLSFTRATNKIALYGPVWELFAGIPYMLGVGNFITILFSFKLSILLFYVATIILIYKISKNVFPVLFFALNPLVVIETLISAHNDIIMMFFALLSFWFILKKKLLFSLLFLALSILIKYATIFLLPVIVYVIKKHYIDKKEINYEKVFYLSSLLMIIIFLLSPLREEIYTWYAIWFLTFIALVPKRRFILYASSIFSFSLLLRYTPFMITGTYLSPTPILKTIISFTPVLLFSIYYVLKKKT